ncbi:plasmid transfer protein TraF [Hirschia baltica ATCC 49814]|uniref:Plasmid transfer protein TraF n=2 Tax=Hirschia TaxID=2723 RepID=C6XP94_HIRBI|nr:plasmid transfer protein TraF [Hirschia baltica ATCC 49814]
MFKSQYLFIGIVGVFMTVISTIPIQSRLIWNRTQSAPLGLYWLTKQAPVVGDLALISAKSDEAIWAQNHGYTGPKWPLLKLVSATQDDVICRVDEQIIINNSHIAITLSYPQDLPKWEGCFKLGNDERFLLNPHPHSLDGRYFGLTNQQDIEGKLIPIWTYTP